jgi:hypothetical protein
MSLNKTLLALSLGLAIAACSSVARDEPKTSPLVTCTHNSDSAKDFSYYMEDVQQWTTEDGLMDIFLIDTVSSGQIALNSPELQNYDCK